MHVPNLKARFALITNHGDHTVQTAFLVVTIESLGVLLLPQTVNLFINSLFTLLLYRSHLNRALEASPSRR
jgi:hypothetical protein